MRRVAATLLAGARRADHRRARSGARRGRARCSATRRRAMVLTGARARAAGAGRQQRARLHQPRAGARAGRQAVQRLRHADRTGQRPGRPRARAEGRPAARLPAHRRSRRAPAHRRRLGRAGGGDSRRRASPPSSCSTSLGPTAASARCSSSARTSSVSAPDAHRDSSSGCESLDLLVVSDFFLSETAALADVVLPRAQWAEEDGTMTNLEGRVILRRRARRPARRRAHRPRHPRARSPQRSAAAR